MHRWKIKVPAPAQNKVTETVRPEVNSSPVASLKKPVTRIGTKIVAPNMANIC